MSNDARVVLALAMLLGGCLIGGDAGSDVDPLAAASKDVVSGTAPAASGLRSKVDAFQKRLGPAFEQIFWEGVADTQSSPNPMPADRFQLATGAFFSTPGTALTVSNSTQLAFSDLNASYATEFPQFSAPKLFTPTGSNIVDVTFFVPGTVTPATVSAFGAVFVDVDSTSATTMELFDDSGISLGGPRVVPARDKGLSFLGVSLVDQRIARVRLTLGTTAIGPGDGAASDVVVVDNLLFSVPQSGSPPPPPSPSSGFALDVFGIDSAKSTPKTTGNEIFLSIQPNTLNDPTVPASIDLSLSAGDVQVSDADGTDGRAAFSLPVDPSGTTSYSVFIAALTQTTIAPCGTNPVNNEFLCNIGSVVVVPSTGVTNVEPQLVRVKVTFNPSLPLFSFGTFGIFWEFSQNLRKAKLRFLPAGTVF